MPFLCSCPFKKLSLPRTRSTLDTLLRFVESKTPLIANADSTKAFIARQNTLSIRNLRGDPALINITVQNSNGHWIGLAYTEEKIVATTLGYSKERTLKSLIACLPPNSDYQIAEKASDFAEKTVPKLKEVHLGGQPFTDFSLAKEYVPEPLARVLKTAAFIPIGYVASYGSIARAAGTEPQTVGKIMASNPLYPIVQCHRVVGTDFSLVGYGGRKTPQALKNKLARLDEERKGYKTQKEIPINGTTLKVHPVEYVIEKAKKQGLSLSDKRRRTLTSY